MTKEVCNRLENFLYLLLDYKLELIEIDIYVTEKYKKKSRYFTFNIDTLVPQKPTGSTFGLSFGTQKVYFSVCIDDGYILLTKDDYESFKDYDIDFALKWSKIIEEKHRLKQKSIVDNIINSTTSELRLSRENNIKKLIG